MGLCRNLFPLLVAVLLHWPRLGGEEVPREIIGSTAAEAIIGHPDFSGPYERSSVEPELARRWGAIDTPCTLVVVFGSWCGDSHRWVPDAIRLMEEPNPFVSVHWIGVPRSKKAKKGDWPPQSLPRKTKKVPTFWLFAPTQGGGVRLAGSIVENPPKGGQGMAEALVELLEIQAAHPQR
jgi:hypothetical protein